MRDMIKTAMPLFIICFIVALCLACVNALTSNTIKQKEILTAENQRKEVMNTAKSFQELNDWKEKDESGLIKEVYAAYDGQKLVGYVFSAYPKGYGGEIKVTVGIDSDKNISGVRIGENNETPGLGAKASDDEFTGQYSGMTILKEFKVVKKLPEADNEIQAISGATISSKAVTSAVQASAKLGYKLLGKGVEK